MASYLADDRLGSYGGSEVAEHESAWRLVLGELDHPRCARELRERTGLPRKTVESSLTRMAARRIVVCVTPQIRQARLYEPTTLGRLMRLHHGHANGLRELPQEYLHLYAFVQAGQYRRLIVQCLDEPLTPKQLRRQILKHYDRIGIGHVYRVAGVLERMRLLTLDGPMYSLSRLGFSVRSNMILHTTARSPHHREASTSLATSTR